MPHFVSRRCDKRTRRVSLLRLLPKPKPKDTLTSIQLHPLHIQRMAETDDDSAAAARRGSGMPPSGGALIELSF